jgi:two-component system LytT family sensor kinase
LPGIDYHEGIATRPSNFDVSMATEMRQRGLMWGLIVGPWLLFAPLAVAFAYMQLSVLGKPIIWGQLLGLTALDCSLLAASTYLINHLNQRFAFDRLGWRRPLLVHSIALLVISICRSALLAPVYYVLGVHAELQLSTLAWFQVLFTVQFPSFVLVYWLILGVCMAVAYYQKYRERELRAAQLETQLAQAQLQVLKMQLHPHFLFNTLNAISALMHRDVELADRMIARLGELLRSTLEITGAQEVSLKRELEFITPYLEIEQARLGPRLTVQMTIAPDVMDACVPNFLLQPLVENAIRHGIAPRAEPGRIEISARRVNGTLELCVRDDGPGLHAAATSNNGIGLGNTKARLQQLYGAAHRFEVQNAPERGLVATVAIPFREHDGQAESRMESNGSHPSAHRG